jgi:hypothetical protein
MSAQFGARRNHLLAHFRFLHAVAMVASLRVLDGYRPRCELHG